MRAARTDAGARAKPMAVPAVAKVTPVVDAPTKGIDFPGLDNELMNKADNIQKEIADMEAKPKKITLAAQKQESTKERAARFFATHGLMDMGRILGDDMSTSAAKAARKQAAADRNRMTQLAGTAVHAAETLSSSVPSIPKSASASVDDIPLDDDEDVKSKWKA